MDVSFRETAKIIHLVVRKDLRESQKIELTIVRAISHTTKSAIDLDQFFKSLMNTNFNLSFNTPIKTNLHT